MATDAAWKTALKTAGSQVINNLGTTFIPLILTSAGTLWTVSVAGHTITIVLILECIAVLLIIFGVILGIRRLLTIPRLRYSLFSFNRNPYEGVWIERYSIIYNNTTLYSVSVFNIYSDATKNLKIRGKVFLIQTGEHFSDFSGEVLNQDENHMVYRYNTDFRSPHFIKGSHHSAEGFGTYKFHPSPPGSKFIGFATGEFVELIGAEPGLRPHSTTQVEHVPPKKVHDLLRNYYPDKESEYRLLAQDILKSVQQETQKVPMA